MKTIVWTIFVLLLPFPAALCGQRPITPEDCVRTRYVTEIKLSPNGQQVAYVVEEANLDRNVHEHLLYIRDMSRSEQRENGKLLLRSDWLANVTWTRHGRAVTVLAEADGKSEIRIIDIDTGNTTTLASSSTRIDGYSISAGGDMLAFTADATGPNATGAEEKAAINRKREGYPVLPGKRVQFAEVEHQKAVYLVKDASSPRAVRSRIQGKDPITGEEINSFEAAFQGRNSLEPELSPDGNYLLFQYSTAMVPDLWKSDPRIKRWMDIGGHPVILVLYDIRQKSLELAYDNSVLSLGALWSTDSRAYAVNGFSPVGSDWLKQDLTNGQEGIEDTHLFSVEVQGHKAMKVASRLADEADLPVYWGTENSKMVLKLDGNRVVEIAPMETGWKEIRTAEMNLRDNYSRGQIASDGRRIVGTYETTAVPPDLFAFDLEAERTSMLTDLNPEYRILTQGKIDPIQWSDSYAVKRYGYLIYPVNYMAGRRYPLVVMTEGESGQFMGEFGGEYHLPGFPIQPLANAGIFVLIGDAARTRNDSPQNNTLLIAERKSLAKRFGNMAEPYEGIDRWVSGAKALVERGLVDRGKIGIKGFSRSGWGANLVLQHSSFEFTAASAADFTGYNYGAYWISGTADKQEEFFLGGPPYGKTLNNWLNWSLAFNADKVRAPLMIESMGHGAPEDLAMTLPTSLALMNEYFVALKRQGKAAEMYYYPDAQHSPDHPLERLASLRRNLAWFRFWLEGYEGAAPEHDPEQYMRWRKLREQQEWNNRMRANGKEPSAEFLRQTSPGAVVSEADRAPAAKESVH